MSNPIDTFIAQLSGFESPEDYRNNKEQLFNQLITIDLPSRTTVDNAASHYALLSAFDSVDCYLFNAGQSKREGVDELNARREKLATMLSRFSTSCQIKDHTTRAAARYLFWNYKYNEIDRNDVLLFLKEQGALRTLVRGEHTTLYVVGLHGKIGDNVFRPDRFGREHRRYVGSCAVMAFSCHYDDLADKDDFLSDIPPLESFRSEYSFADAKGCVRPVRLTQKERMTLTDKFIASTSA